MANVIAESLDIPTECWFDGIGIRRGSYSTDFSAINAEVDRATAPRLRAHRFSSVAHHDGEVI
jgi:hypothetical protein